MLNRDASDAALVKDVNLAIEILQSKGLTDEVPLGLYRHCCRIISWMHFAG